MNQDLALRRLAWDQCKKKLQSVARPTADVNWKSDVVSLLLWSWCLLTASSPRDGQIGLLSFISCLHSL